MSFLFVPNHNVPILTMGALCYKDDIQVDFLQMVHIVYMLRGIQIVRKDALFYNYEM